MTTDRPTHYPSTLTDELCALLPGQSATICGQSVYADKRGMGWQCDGFYFSRRAVSHADVETVEDLAVYLRS